MEYFTRRMGTNNRLHSLIVLRLSSFASDYAGNLDDRKSTSGYVFMPSGGAVSWFSKKQPIVTLSTTETATA